MRLPFSHQSLYGMSSPHLPPSFEGKYTIVASTSTQKIIFFRGLTIVVANGKSKVGQKKKICVLLN